MLISTPTGRVPAMSVQDYLKSERQWPRSCRLVRARAEKRKATGGRERAFWNQIIKANQTE